MSIVTPQRLSSATRLGIKVNNSEASRSAAFSLRTSAPLVSDTPHFSPVELTERLRSLQPSSQARRCGSWIGGSARVSTFANGETGIVGCSASCSSPRCPRCRVSLMSRRRDEIQACIDWWLSAVPGAAVSMLTLTAPHTPDHSLSRLLGSTKRRFGLAGAVALLKERALWKKYVVEYVSGQEVTHGSNGFHPHYHVLVFHVGELNRRDWYRSWAKACRDAGLGAPSFAHGLTLQPAESAAAYMAKWGLAAESTGSHFKDAKHGSFSIAAIEQLAAQGQAPSRSLLKKYYRAMRGRRTHTFSRGLAGVRLRHVLGFKPVTTHFIFDKASSYSLYKDVDFKKVIVKVLIDYKMPVLHVFADLKLVASLVDYTITPMPKLSYSVRLRARNMYKGLSKSFDKYADVYQKCFHFVDTNKRLCL